MRRLGVYGQPRAPRPHLATAPQPAARRGDFRQGGPESVLVHRYARGLGGHHHPLYIDDSVARVRDNFTTPDRPTTTGRCAKTVTHLC